MPQHVEAAFTAMFATRSGSERVRMACAMFDDAKALAEANIRAANPNIGPGALRVELFKRLYFDDFDADTMARILILLAED